MSNSKTFDMDTAVAQLIAKTASMDQYYEGRIGALEAENAKLRKQVASVSKKASDVGDSGMSASLELEYEQAVDGLAAMGLIKQAAVPEMKTNPSALFGMLSKSASVSAPSMEASRQYREAHLPVDRKDARLASNVMWEQKMQRMRALTA